MVVFLSRISSLNLLSFNIQNFGVTKYSNQGVIDNLIDVSEDGDQASMASVIKIVFCVLPKLITLLYR